MLGTYTDSVATSGAQLGRALVGHWTIEMGTSASTQIVGVPLPRELSERSLMHTATGQRLIWVWILQSKFVAGNVLRGYVYEQSDLIRKREDH